MAGRPKGTGISPETAKAIADEYFSVTSASYKYLGRKYGISGTHAKRLVEQYADGRVKEIPKGRNYEENQARYRERKAQKA